MFYINTLMKSLKTYLFLIIVAFAFSNSVCGQDVSSATDNLFQEAVTLQKHYKFKEAESIYNKLIGSDLDPSALTEVQERIVQCHNGQNLMQFIIRPVAIAAADFRLEDFFLHLQDIDQNSWMPVPNPFVNITAATSNPFCQATYFSTKMESDGNIIYCAPNENGLWKIYTSSRRDSSLWSLPQLLSPNISSGGNEIFPYISPDGNTLYFASDGFAGMGGYDLFYSTMDKQTGNWSAPENLGFPYSSSGNDIFYADSEDGRYSIVVSDRETAYGSVRIYVTNHIATPVKTKLEENEDPVVIASMQKKTEDSKNLEKDSIKKESIADSQMSNYSKMIGDLNALRNEHREKLAKLEESRMLYEKAKVQDKEFLSEIIMEVENEALQIKKRLDEAAKEVHKVEMDFLANGIIPIVEKQQKENTSTTPKENTAQEKYIFPNHKLRSIPYIVLEQPKPKFDYTFKVRGKNDGQFAEDNTLPDGIIYQIQFVVLKNKAGKKDLKGLSPVFVYKQPSGKYVHTVGLFKTYAEASSNLKAVRKAGFPEAFLVAYKNGKSISVKTARQQEGKPVANTESSWQLVISGYPNSLPSGIVTAIRNASNKDITKTSGENGTLFIIGPFSQNNQVEELAKLLKGLGVNGISIENVKIN